MPHGFLVECRHKYRLRPVTGWLTILPISLRWAPWHFCDSNPMGCQCVRLDLPKLAKRLSASFGRPVQSADARLWLHDLGFEASGDNWFCDAEQIAQLQPGEIREIISEGKEGGITYIHRRGPSTSPSENPE